MMRTFLITTLLIGTSLCLRAEGLKSAAFFPRISKARPNAKLPAHIQATPGSMTLVADIAADRDHGVPLYLINSTAQTLMLSSYPHIKLEVKTPDGSWKRAQAHEYGDCGIQYDARVLPTGQHYKLYGYQADGGEPATTRFAYYLDDADLTTKPFQGVFLKQDLKDAETDQLSIRNVPYVLIDPITRLIGGTSKTLQNDKNRRAVILALSMWKHFGPVPRVRKDVDKLIVHLKQMATNQPELQPLIAEIRKTSAQPFHPNASPTQLAKYCLAELEGRHEKERNANKRWLVNIEFWSTLEILCRTKALAHPVEKEIFHLALEHQVQRFFTLQQKTDECLRTSDLWKTLSRSNDHNFRAAVWRVIIRRLNKEEILKKIRNDYTESRLAVLTIYMQTSENHQLTKIEKELWLRECRSSPFKTFCAMQTGFRNWGNSHPGGFLAKEAREFWEQELEKSEAAQKDFEYPEEARLAANFMASVEKSCDVQFWQRMANFRGYSSRETIREATKVGETKLLDVVEHNYDVRKVAHDVLSRNDHLVENDLPLKKKISAKPFSERKTE